MFKEIAMQYKIFVYIFECHGTGHFKCIKSTLTTLYCAHCLCVPNLVYSGLKCSKILDMDLTPKARPLIIIQGVDKNPRKKGILHLSSENGFIFTWTVLCG